MTSPPSDQSSALVPGTRFAGQYEIVRLLGAGGMGVVYEARRDGHPEPVALKVLHRHLVANRQVSKRFHREAEILRRLDGEHLVPLVDFGESSDGRLYMALACVDGDALDRVVAVRGQLSVDDAVGVVIDVCRALSAAHAIGVVHRDLKPANVILETRPEGGTRVRVCDFGLGKVFRETGFANTALTEQHMIFGTPEYMSPEQVRGEEVDPRADVYAAGCLLYELLTGKAPFLGKTSVATMSAHLTEEAEPPSSRAPTRGVSRALDAVVMHALAKDRNERYATAAELAEALEGARRAPDDVASTRPPAHPLGDTDLALPKPAPPNSIDPLGMTMKSKPAGAPPSPSPPIQISIRPPPPATAAPASGDRPSSRRTTGTSKRLSRPADDGPAPWVWLVVAVAAAAIGIAIGLVMTR